MWDLRTNEGEGGWSVFAIQTVRGRRDRRRRNKTESWIIEREAELNTHREAQRGTRREVDREV